MPSRRSVALAAAAVLVVVTAVLLVVRPFDRDAEGVDRALAVVPADVDEVLYVDATAADDLLVGQGPQLLATYADAMADGAWSMRDVDWWVEAEQDGTALVVVALADDVDLDAVAAELEEHGFVESEARGRRSFVLEDPSRLGDYPVLAGRVTYLDDGLLVLGGPDTVLDVVDAGADAFADRGGVDELLAGVDRADGADGLVAAALRAGDDACGASFAAPDGLADLPDADPRASASLVLGAAPDHRVEVVLAYDDEAAAEADAAVREELLASEDPALGLGGIDLEVDGSRVDGPVAVVEVRAEPGRLAGLLRGGQLTLC